MPSCLLQCFFRFAKNQRTLKGGRRVTKIKQAKTKGLKLDFAPQESVTAFGGAALVRRLSNKLGVGSLLRRLMPERRGDYSFHDIVMSGAFGLLTGAQGTFATQVVREDAALLRLIGVGGAPEEATFWRSLEQMGEEKALKALETVTTKAACRAIGASSREALLDHGFLPVFIDGTLLEGSAKREGTKYIKEKGSGLMWTAAFVGPYPVLGDLAKEGEGEATAMRTLARRVNKEVLVPANLAKDALVLCDSLHGNGPTLDVVEDEGLSYIIGTLGLVRAETVLCEQPDVQWRATPDYDKSRGVCQSAVATAHIQCEEWREKRCLVGRRWKRNGECIWNYASVVTNLCPENARVASLMKKRKCTFAEAVWLLYDRKGACENRFKDLLIDLGLHHPPCREWQRNAGFYALGILAALLGIATAVIGTERSKGGRRERQIRLSTFRRWLLAVPARIAVSGRTITATILGLSEGWQKRIERRFDRIARC